VIFSLTRSKIGYCHHSIICLTVRLPVCDTVYINYCG